MQPDEPTVKQRLRRMERIQNEIDRQGKREPRKAVRAARRQNRTPKRHKR